MSCSIKASCIIVYRKETEIRSTYCKAGIIDYTGFNLQNINISERGTFTKNPASAHKLILCIFTICSKEASRAPTMRESFVMLVWGNHRIPLILFLYDDSQKGPSSIKWWPISWSLSCGWHTKHELINSLSSCQSEWIWIEIYIE